MGAGGLHTKYNIVFPCEFLKCEFFHTLRKFPKSLQTTSRLTEMLQLDLMVCAGHVRSALSVGIE